jgi:opacity protein-like surface antigen
MQIPVLIRFFFTVGLLKHFYYSPKTFIMKKTYFTTMFMILALAGFSQTEKGSWLLGGNIAYASTHETETGSSSTYSTFTLNPKIGFFPVNNFAVILNTNYISESSGNFNDHILSIGPSVRYYFPGSESVRFFAGTGVGFGSTSDTHNTSYQFEAGPSFFITPAVALELNINYQTTNTKYNNDDPQLPNNYNQSQFGIGFGFIVYLNGKKK